MPVCLSLSHYLHWLTQAGYKSSQAHPAKGKEEPHIFREVSLESFTPHSGHPPGSEAVDDKRTVDHHTEPTYYTYPCRCSRLFVITHQDLEDGVDVIGCEGCGEWIRVTYEIQEEDEAEPALTTPPPTE